VLKGFKDFVLRGNVVDLAVAVVIGAAFTTIVTAFTEGIIKPLINAVTPPTSPGFGVELIDGKQSTYVDVAAVITAAVNFLIVAAVVYFVIVVPLNTLKARRKQGEETGPAEPTDVELLAEIRDLLAARGGRGDADTGRPVIGDGRSDEHRV
jgi:large conductance mechanosensitive channel